MQPRHDTEFSRSIPATAQQVSAAGVDFSRLLDQAGQERSVERFAGEFAAVGVRVLPGDSVVAAANPVMTF